MRGFLRVLDPGRSFGLPQLAQPRNQVVEVAAAGRVGRDLAEHGHRDGLAELPPAGHSPAVAVECEPAPVPVRIVERTEADSLSGEGLGGNHRRHDVSRSGVAGCESRDSLELVRKRSHDARIEPVPTPMPARDRQDHARALFAPLGPSYDRVGAALSLGQDPLWRRFLVSRLPQDGGHVLDVATGTGLVAAELLKRGFRVTGVDQSPEMIAVARSRFAGRVALVEASAEDLPFERESFDHVTFTYLLRYVDDPRATVAELARVLRPGGTLASLEFGVPRGPARPLWDVYVGAVLPLAGRALANGWREVGAFLGGSIRTFWGRYPLERQLDWWQAAGLHGVEARRLSLGGAVVIWGTKT